MNVLGYQGAMGAVNGMRPGRRLRLERAVGQVVGTAYALPRS
jgi:hypothetical protein